MTTVQRANVSRVYLVGIDRFGRFAGAGYRNFLPEPVRLPVTVKILVFQHFDYPFTL